MTVGTGGSSSSEVFAACRSGCRSACRSEDAPVDVTTISSTGIPCKSASCWRRASRSAATRPTRRCAVPNCCVIILRWRFSAPITGSFATSGRASTAAASTCIPRARSSVRAARLGFLPKTSMTRPSGVVAEASVAGRDPFANSTAPALASSRAPEVPSVRGDRERSPF